MAHVSVEKATRSLPYPPPLGRSMAVTVAYPHRTRNLLHNRGLIVSTTDSRSRNTQEHGLEAINQRPNVLECEGINIQRPAVAVAHSEETSRNSSP